MIVIIILFNAILLGWIFHLLLEEKSPGYLVNAIVSLLGSLCGSIIYNFSSLPIHTLWGLLASATIGSLALILPIIAISDEWKKI